MNRGLILRPIKGHHEYSELAVWRSVRLYVEPGCGFRGVVKALSVVKDVLGWDFLQVRCPENGADLPCLL